MKSVYDAACLFWSRYPALAHGLAILIGCWTALEWHWSALLPILGLLLSTRPRQTTLLIILGLTTYTYCTTRFELPNLPDQGIAGTASIAITRISQSSTFIGSGWVLKGQLHHFNGPLQIRGGHFKLSIPGNWQQPLPDLNYNYILKGQLYSLGHGHYSLKVSKNTPWIKNGTNINLTNWRYRVKKTFSDYLRQQFQNPKVSAFLIGLTTGEFSDPQTQNALAKLGVQHLLAISGFHFALFAGLLSISLRMLFSRRQACILLTLILAFYFTFLGYGPSIARAWLMITLALTAELLELPYKGLNSLGIALIALLIWDPLSALEAGFQLSFLATAAILLLYPLVDQGLQQLLPKRPLSGLAEMKPWDQHAYLVLSLFRQAAALILSVHLAVVPVCLYLFHTYPLIGLVTNLFYPFFAGLSLTWLAFTIPLQTLIPPLGPWMHAINQRFTEALLNLAYDFPPKLQLPLQFDSLTSWMVLLYLTALLASNILIHHYRQENPLAFT